MRKAVRIGIIGTGFAADFHLASYRKIYGERFRITAICGRDRSRTTALAKIHGIARCHDSIAALMRDPDIDAVDICAPNHLHIPIILEAAAAGKHVICEKPLGGYFGPSGADDTWNARDFPREQMLAAVVEQTGAVQRAIETSGVTFCYAENWVYAPPVVKLDRLMAASDSIILRIEGEESHSGSHSEYARSWRTAGGGSLLRLCVHPIGAALHLKYREGQRRGTGPIRPVAVLAQVANLTRIDTFSAQQPKHIVSAWNDVEDWAGLVITFEDGSIAQLTSTDTRLGGIHNRLVAHGSRAVVTANINPNNLCQAYTPAASYFSDEYIVEKTETKAGWSFPAPDEDAVTGYPEELRDFVGAISQSRAPRSGLMLASDVLLVVYAGYLSAERAGAVDLRPYLQSFTAGTA